MKRKFTLYDLIQNTDFVQWVRTGKEESFSWNEWITHDPENKKKVRIAKSIVLSIESQDEKISSEKLTTIWKVIEDEMKDDSMDLE
ncbi:hypothetical protein [Membranihabitans maritimus]|uniref:hypothetical protein n=1 Tax=Membranihabitans maritimus TaxID=2904244 RepID=UPI001F431F9F|nr:hypothetical protein [Membranihabitans maritimus]